MFDDRTLPVSGLNIQVVNTGVARLYTRARAFKDVQATVTLVYKRSWAFPAATSRDPGLVLWQNNRTEPWCFGGGDLSSTNVEERASALSIENF